MPRRSPIIVGSLVVAFLVIAVEAFLVLRPKHAPAPEPVPVAVPVPVPAPAPPLPATARPAAPSPTPSPAAEEPPPPSPPAPPPAAAPPADTAALMKKRAQLLSDYHQRLVHDADEKAFETMALPENTRGAIRQINEEYGRRTQTFLAGQTDGGLPYNQISSVNVVGNDEAERARKEALTTVLGEEGARQLDLAEHQAARKMRGQFRREWFRELETQAPQPSPNLSQPPPATTE